MALLHTINPTVRTTVSRSHITTAVPMYAARTCQATPTVVKSFRFRDLRSATGKLRARSTTHTCGTTPSLLTC